MTLPLLLWTAAAGSARKLPDAAAAHARLRGILARAEFVHVHQPGLFTVLWNRLLAWLWHGFARAAGVGARSEWLGRVFWGVLVAAGVGALLWWFRRSNRRRPPLARKQTPDRTSAPREWEQWQAEALRLADSGQWRSAIHALYWAAVGRIEADGRWSRDRARTPRELLALLPAELPARREFTLLTMSFEQVWYGARAAEARDFEAAREWFSRLEAAR